MQKIQVLALCLLNLSSDFGYGVLQAGFFLFDFSREAEGVKRVGLRVVASIHMNRP